MDLLIWFDLLNIDHCVNGESGKGISTLAQPFLSIAYIFFQTKEQLRLCTGPMVNKKKQFHFQHVEQFWKPKNIQKKFLS